MEKKYTVYFGAGGAGLNYCKNTATIPDFFLDNNEQIWGQQLLGREVLNPASLKADQVKKLVITSGYVKDISAQLKALGVPDEVVELPAKRLLGFHPFKEEGHRVEAAKRLSHLSASIGPEHKVVAVGGTALGFCRQKDFIVWDFDIDLFLPISAKDKFIRSISDIGGKLINEGSATSFTFSFPLNDQIDVPVGVDMFDETKAVIVDKYEDYEWEWSSEMFLNCEAVTIHGQTLFVPSPHDKYLSGVYGSTWRQPNPDFSYNDYGEDQ